MSNNLHIVIKAACVYVGYKGQYGASIGPMSLTRVEESGLPDNELIALGQSRLEAKLADLRARSPHYNMFRLDVRVCEVAVGNPAYVAAEDDDWE